MRRAYQFVLATGLGLLVSGAAMAQTKTAPAAGTAARAQFYNGYGQTPWFGAPNILQHLNLSPTQYNQLNQAYGKSWNAYHNSMSNLGNLSGNQPNNQAQQYYNTFNNSVNQAAQNTLNSQQYQRFQQLNRQYQGYFAFNDPTLQQGLRLTARQKQLFDEYAREFNQQVNGMVNSNNKSTAGSAAAYAQMRNQMNQRINSILTPIQRQVWQRMIGSPYNNFALPGNP